MHPAPPALLEPAIQLRYLRTEHWLLNKPTQAVLARVLGGEEGLAPATVAPWSLAPEPALVPLDSFTPEEQATYKELLGKLLRLHSAARGGTVPEALIVTRRSWHFTDSGPLTLVCAQLPKEEASPLGDPANPKYTQLLGFADLDTMVELHGHIRAENPGMACSLRPLLK